MGEYLWDGRTVVLNRFYNDLENYRFLQHQAGYMLMVGENDIVVTTQGVNRKVLMEMKKNAYMERFVSFGVERLHVLGQLEPQHYDRTLLAIGSDFIILFKLKLTPS